MATRQSSIKLDPHNYIKLSQVTTVRAESLSGWVCSTASMHYRQQAILTIVIMNNLEVFH